MKIGSRSDVDESFTAFVAARSGRLTAQAYLLCGDAEQARDIVQTVLARVYARWAHVEREDPYAYVAAAVTNAVTDWWRIAHRRHERPTDVLPDAGTVTPHQAVDDGQALAAALARLTRRERAVIVLRYLDDRSEQEVARLLRIRAGTVKSTAHKALRKLRTTLAWDGESPDPTNQPEGAFR